MKRWMLSVAVLLGMFTTCEAAWFKRCKPACEPVCCEASPCNYVTEARTVMVPEWYNEYRTITCTESRYETRTRTVTCCRKVPVVEQVPYTYTVNVPEKRTRVETYYVSVPVCTPQVRTYTVCVPYTEKRMGTRTVARKVQAVEARTCTRDMGHWEERCVEKTMSASVSCGKRSWFARICGRGHCDTCCDCCPETVVCKEKYWVPCPVPYTENVTVCKMECVQEPYEYCVTLYRNETRQETINVVTCAQEARTREVCFTVCVPKVMTGVRCVTSCKVEAYEVPQTYCVCVPCTVQKQVCCKACRMVPKTIYVKVPAPCAPAPCCSAPAIDCCGAACCH